MRIHNLHNQPLTSNSGNFWIDIPRRDEERWILGHEIADVRQNVWYTAMSCGIPCW